MTDPDGTLLLWDDDYVGLLLDRHGAGFKPKTVLTRDGDLFPYPPAWASNAYSRTPPSREDP